MFYSSEGYTVRSDRILSYLTLSHLIPSYVAVPVLPDMLHHILLCYAVVCTVVGLSHSLRVMIFLFIELFFNILEISVILTVEGGICIFFSFFVALAVVI